MKMDYDNFNDVTKNFLNKAMDIYSTIKDEEIKKIVGKGDSVREYTFTKVDKKILSLFISGFLVNGNLKKIIEEYEDLKLQDFLDFANIKERTINNLPEEEYSDFYKENFKLIIINILKSSIGIVINFVTPEVIVNCFSHAARVNGSEVLNCFSETYGLGRFFSDHPLFTSLENYVILTDSVSKKVYESEKSSLRSTSYGGVSSQTQTNRNYNYSHGIAKKETIVIDYSDASVWLLLDDIQKKFIAQEEATKYLFYNIINNQQLAEINDVPDGQRSVIFFDGESGTGKTAITREIAARIGVPFEYTAITNYSAAGYKGADLVDILKSLYAKADGDLEKAQRGIVLLDEFDKIVSSSKDSELEMKKAVQHQLLDFLGGGKYTIRVGESALEMGDVEFDTSKLTFVCAGALTDLRETKSTEKKSAGFNANVEEKKKENYEITPKDLINIGYEKELVRRLNTYLHTNTYSKSDLKRILQESIISPLIGFRKWIELKGKKLEVSEDTYDLIVDQAYEYNMGAGGLQIVMNNIRTHFLEEVLRGENHTIYLDAETVAKIHKDTISRKGRA